MKRAYHTRYDGVHYMSVYKSFTTDPADERNMAGAAVYLYMFTLLVYSCAYLDNILTGEVRLVAKRAKDRVFLVKQHERGTEFNDSSGIHDEDAVVVH